jgi:hypothetical protein
MRRVVFLLCLLSCLLTSFQAQANPANCDGDLPPDKAELLELASGLNPLIWGTVSLMKGCEQVKKFLANLGVSKSTTSLSNAQVESALGSMGQTLPATPTASRRAVIGTLAQAQAKRDELLRKDRELAANLVPVCKSIMSAQTCEGRLLAIESLRDEVARWNKDPELMAFIPSVTLDSPDLIAQTGWERGAGGGGWYNRAGNKADREVCPELANLINGLVANAPERARERLPEFRNTCAERDPSYAAWLPRWESQLASVSTKAGTKGGAYVRPEDCERLSRQIDADLRARPKEEPPSLSFFEVECASDASGKYAGQVASWKQAITSRKGTEALNQWDGGIRQAEAEQKKAKEEDERRVAEQKRRQEGEAVRRAAAEKAASEATQTRMAQSTGSGYLDKLESKGTKAFLLSINGCKIIDSHTANINYLTSEMRWSGFCGANGLADGKGVLRICYRHFLGDGCSEMDGTFNNGIPRGRFFMRYFMRDSSSGAMVPNKDSPDSWSEFEDGCYRGSGEQGCDPSAPQQLQARYMAGGGKLTPARSAADTSTDTAACEAAIKKADTEVASTPPSQQGAMAALQFAMWATRKRSAALDANCPSSGKYATMRRELQQAHDSAAAGCRQLKSGGGECTPERN